MKSLNKILIGLLIGCAFLMFFCLAAITIWFYFDRNENDVLIYVATGLLAGLIIDFRYLKGWISRRFELPIRMFVGLYLFYNIGLYGLIGSQYYLTKLTMKRIIKLIITFDPNLNNKEMKPKNGIRK